jgi:AbrB family looped-hinge helix DNA binding protein
MRVNKDFRVTIPKALRDRMGFHPGTEVEMVRVDGGIAIRRVADPAGVGKPERVVRQSGRRLLSKRAVGSDTP